jgi:DOMON domain
MKIILLFALGMCLSGLFLSDRSQHSIEVNGMKVHWSTVGRDIAFELSAPTTGWIAIGFNETESLAGTYLVMARVRAGVAAVVEYKTLAPGDYRPITALGGRASVVVIGGAEQGNSTSVRFRIPQLVTDGFHKQLLPSSKWRLLVAYSREDDFQHHSMMRTNVEINL